MARLGGRWRGVIQKPGGANPLLTFNIASPGPTLGAWTFEFWRRSSSTGKSYGLWFEDRSTPAKPQRATIDPAAGTVTFLGQSNSCTQTMTAAQRSALSD